MTPAAAHHLVSLLVLHPQGGWGCGNRQATLQPHPRFISLAIKPTKTRGKDGVRREEGLCIFLYLWQIAVLAWFKLPMEISTSQPAQRPMGPPAQVRRQPISLCLAGLHVPPATPCAAFHLAIIKHSAQGGGSLISIKMWSPRSCSQ